MGHLFDFIPVAFQSQKRQNFVCVITFENLHLHPHFRMTRS